MQNTMVYLYCTFRLRRDCRMKKGFKRIAIYFIIGVCCIACGICGCPIYRFFNVLCPTCGTTRAWLCFFSGDLIRAFQYNLFFLFIPELIYFYIFPPRKVFLKFILMFFSTLLFFFNVLRWFGMFVLPS